MSEQSSAYIDARRTLLSDFLHRLYAPWCLGEKARQMTPHYASSIGWLAKAIGRPPLLVDLDRDNLVAALQFAAEAGIERDRLKTIRTQIGQLHKYALQLQIITTAWESTPLPRSAYPTARALRQDDGPLLRFYRRAFRKELATRTADRNLRSHDRAVVHFSRFLGEHWQGQPVSPAAVTAFCDRLAGEGKKPNTVQQYRDCLRRVLAAFVPELEVPRHDQRPSPAAESPSASPSPSSPTGARMGNFRERVFGRRRQLPAPSPGSLRELYHDGYRPQRLIDADWQTPYGYERTLECFYVHCGGDLPVRDLSDARLLDYLQKFRDAGCAPRTYNQERSRLVALWNFAYQERLIDTQPRIRKLREYRDPPEAWNETQMRELLARCDIFTGRAIGDFPKDLWWRAALLVTYWTACRRRALLSIRCDDVDLQRRTVRIRGRGMKNRSGQVYRVGQECVDAMTTLWQPQPRELVFPLPRPGYSVSNDFKRIKTAAGLPNDGRLFQQFHKVRRTSATCTAAKAGLQAAATLCGHSSAVLTRDSYIDPTLVETSVTDYLSPLLPIAIADGEGGAQ